MEIMRRRYIPCRVRYLPKQMRERLIRHPFYIIFSEEAEFEVEALGICYGRLKNGIYKCQKTGFWKVLEDGVQRCART